MLALLSTLNTYLQFSSLFISTNVSKCEITNQRTYEDYISNGRTKIKLAMLAFLYCGEIVKNSFEAT